MWHGYFLVVVTGTVVSNKTKRSALKKAFPHGLRSIMEESKLLSEKPHERLQIRVRLDDKAVLAEGAWKRQPGKEEFIAFLVAALGQEGADALGISLEVVEAALTANTEFTVFADAAEASKYIYEHSAEWQLGIG